MSTEDIFVGKILRRLVISIILCAAIIVASLLLSAFVTFDLYQRIIIVISGIVIALTFIAVVWIQWVKTIIKQEEVLKR